LFDNVTYGLRLSARYDLAAVLDDAQLRDCVHRLPDGLRTPLGEDGTLVSGGEGQRIRIGRGFGRQDARLVILDEPARGLDRHRRAEILAHCRERWPGATMLCVTHDVAYTLQFDRVLVVHSGLVVEDGPPCVLAEMAGSRYAAMLATDRDSDERLWRRPSWRRLIARRGSIAEVAP
jgi:ATP-binding cassette subfamily B protein